MPLPNRVGPDGGIVATPERGTAMGNRGRLHDGDRRIRRPWALTAWLACRLDFNGRQRRVMAPDSYTELFFLDEATALAAGHRPCWECRRADFHAFAAAWAAGHGLAQPPRAGAMDAALHAQRIDPATRRQRRWSAEVAGLPDGAFVALAAGPHLVWGEDLLPWSFAGYGAPLPRSGAGTVAVMTPPGTVRALAAGYRPGLHPALHPGASVTTS
ncbi:MAG: hypothetical protein AB7G39_10185 [Alphaproteobacteria bacterium]